MPMAATAAQAHCCPRAAVACWAMGRGSRIRLWAAQLKTNSQSTFSSPRSLTCCNGPVCFSLAESFLYQPAAAQANGIAGMPRSSSVQVAAPRLVVLGHMSGHVQLPDRGYEILRAVSLVCAQGDAPRSCSFASAPASAGQSPRKDPATHRAQSRDQEVDRPASVSAYLQFIAGRNRQ